MLSSSLYHVSLVPSPFDWVLEGLRVINLGLYSIHWKPSQPICHLSVYLSSIDRLKYACTTIHTYIKLTSHV